MFRKVLSFCVLASSALALQMHSAFAGDAVRFEIEAPAKATLGEAIDVTVKAVDSDGNVDTGYRGSIIFTTNYIGDIVPMPGRSIKFEADNSGVYKFSKGVIFKTVAGKRDLNVADVEKDITGSVKLQVEEGNNGGNNQKVEVQILTPQMNGEIKGDVVTVSGKTRKNSKVRISLNGEEKKTVVSDQDGMFTFPITDLTLVNNVVKAEIVDANNKVIGSSQEVKFSKSKDTISFYGVVISDKDGKPSTTLTGSQDMTINIKAMAGLSEAIITFDGAVIPLKEEKPGTYTHTTKAPSKSWSYLLDISLKNETGKTFEKKGISTITVVDPIKPKEEPVITPIPEPTPVPTPEPTPVIPEVKPATFKDIKTETLNNIGKVVFTFAVENPPKNLGYFKINYGENKDALLGEVLTHEVKTILKDGKYSWYVPNLREGDYVFKITALDTNKEPIKDLTSELIKATIGKEACTISNVGPVSVETNQTKSVLTWEPVKGAAGYHLYKITADGEYTLVQKTVDPSHVIYLSKGSVKYDDFAVKAVCADGTESKDYSKTTKVQTGPGAIAFIVILSAFLAFFILRRRKI